MRSFLTHWLFTGIALAVTTHFIPGIAVSSTAALVFGALVLGLVNATVRPVLTLLTLPITVLTIGVFYLIVNGAAFALAAGLVPGFTVASFGAAVGGALVVSIVSFLLNWLLTPRPAPDEQR
jgi:putative membrane protein